MADDPRDPFGSIVIADQEPDQPPKPRAEEREPVVVIGPPEAVPDAPADSDHRGSGSAGDAEETHRREIPGRFPGWLKPAGAAVVLVFLAYCLFGFLGLPYFIQSVLPDIAAKRLQRQITFGTVRFNPFTLVLRLENTIIGPRRDMPEDHIDPIFSAGAVEADISAWSLVRREIICSRLTAATLFLHLQRNPDHTYNTSSLIPLHKSRAFPFYRLPFPLLVGDLTITDSKILFDDLPAGRSHTLENITLSLPLMPPGAGRKDGFFPGRSDSGPRLIAPSFAAVINGSPLAVTGESSIQGDDVVTRLSLRLNGVDVPSYLAYLPGWKPPIAKGKADIEVDTALHLGDGGKSELAVETRIRLADIALAGARKRGSALPLTTITASLFPLENRYVIHEILLTDPVIALGREKNGAWSLPFVPPMATREEGQGDNAPFSLALKKTSVSNGTVTLFDDRPGRPLARSFTGVAFTLAEFDHRAATSAPFSLDGATPEGGRITLRGEINPTTLAVQGKLTGKSIPLATLVPFLTPGDQRLEQGTISDLASTFSWDGNATKDKKFFLHDGTAKIVDYRLGPPQATLLTSPALQLDFTELDPAGRGIDTLRIRGENAEIDFTWDQNGRCNWSGPADTDKRGWKVDGLSFTFAKATLTVRDNTFPTPLSLSVKEAALTGAKLSTRAEHKGEISLTSSNFGQGSLTLQGPLSLSPFFASLRCTLNHFQMAETPPLFSDWLTLSRLAGEADAEGTLQLPGFAYTGSLTLRDVTAAGTDGPPVLGWSKARTEQVTVKLSPFSLVTEKLSLEHPFLHWTITPDGAMNIASLLNHNGMRDKGFANSGQISVNTLAIQEGRLDFRDGRATPPYEQELAVQATIKNFANLPSSRVRMDLNATMDSGAASVNGELGFFEGPLFADLRAEARAVPVERFTPYLAKLLDAEISGGTFTLASRYRRENHAISADNTLVLSGLRLAPGKERAASTLPLAIALLSDTDGNITLSLPLRGNASDAAYSFPSALGRALRPLPLKSKVSPLAMLKNDFPEVTDSLDHLRFSPGSSTLAKEHQTALRTIGRILLARPLLQLMVKGLAAQDVDREALLRNKQDKAQRLKLEEEGKKSLRITEKYGREEISPPRSSQQPAPPPPPAMKISVSSKELRNLAEKRAQAVVDFLAEELKIPRSRLATGDATLIDPGALGLPGSRVDLRFGASGVATP